MSNRRTPSGSERKEPQLSQISNIDRLRDEAAKPTVGGFSSTARESGLPDGAAANGVRAAYHDSNMAKSTLDSSQQVHSNRGVWCVVILLVFGLGGAAGYGYLELQRVSGMQKSMLQRVNQLALTSDQLGSQLNVSGGQLQETQSSMNTRVTELEQKFVEQSKTLATELQRQISENVTKQTKAFEQMSATLRANVSAEMSKSLASAKSTAQSQVESISDLQKEIASLQKSLSGVSLQLKQEITGFEQSLQLLKEELAIDPERLKVLQDQFTTYMQSVDQFRQQTNGSLNELHLQIQDVYKSQSVQQAPTAQATESAEPTGFGVQPLR